MHRLITVKGAIFPYWTIITGGMNWDSYEPTTDSVSFDVFIGMSILG